MVSEQRLEYKGEGGAVGGAAGSVAGVERAWEGQRGGDLRGRQPRPLSSLAGYGACELTGLGDKHRAQEMERTRTEISGDAESVRLCGC